MPLRNSQLALATSRRRGGVRRLVTLGLAVLALVILVGCGPRWEAVLVSPDGSENTVNAQTFERLARFVDAKRGLPLERVLWMSGHSVIERLSVVDEQGEVHEFDWPATAGDAWWREDGRLAIDGVDYSVSRVEAEPPALAAQVQTRITDIGPTVAAVLGLPALEQATGSPFEVPDAERVLLLFLDGFGYVRYTEALEAGLIPNLAALDEPLIALTMYPPSTRVGTAALLTGAPPEITGVDGRKVRKTDVETLFDVAAAAGLRVEAVEGESLAFNLRGADVKLSGDRDGDGSTDDNVLENALDVLDCSSGECTGDAGMPDLLYVHFHGIDDAGHTYGPGSPEEETAIREQDAAVEQILAAVPINTLVIIFADHGMHSVDEGERRGNHGNLIARDMFIPVLATVR